MSALPGLHVVTAAMIVLTIMCVARATERTSCPADVAGNIGWGVVAVVAGWVTIQLILIGVGVYSST